MGFRRKKTKTTAMQKRENDRKSGSPALENQEEGGNYALQPNVGLLRQLKLFVELGAIRKTEDKSAQQYTSKIRDVHKKLTKAGVSISDHALALIMLRGLPMYRYEGLVLRLARDEEKLSSVLVESRLIEEEMRIMRDTEMNAVIREEPETKMHPLDSNVQAASDENEMNDTKIRRVQSQKEETRRSFRNNKDDRVPLGQKKICRSCDDINLNLRHSPKFREGMIEERRKVSKNGDKENKKVKMCNCDQLKNYWILDSGSAEHGTFNKEYMENFKDDGGDICMANGAQLTVEGQGSVKLSLEEECGGGSLVLDGVRYIPELETNLISMGSLDENGMTMLIKDGKAEVQDGGKVLFTAHNEHNVFVVKTKSNGSAKSDRAHAPPVHTAGWRRFSMSDGNDEHNNNSRLQSLWKY